MKVAFLMLVHKDFDLAVRVARLLVADGDSVFIHVDKSSDLLECQKFFTPLHENIHFISKRFDIKWGKFSMIEATNQLIEEAVKSESFDYFYLLSGQCFPVNSLSWLKKKLSLGKEYIESLPVPQPRKPASRLHRETLFVKMIRSLMTIRPSFIFFEPYFVMNFRKRMKLDPYAGSQWWCLSKESIQFIRSYMNRHEAYEAFMRRINIPDESFYHTLVANSPRKTYIDDTLTGVLWKPKTDHPEVISDNNLPELMLENDEMFMIRKVHNDDLVFLEQLEKKFLS